MGGSNEIGARIKELREKHGMTQTELAEKLFTSRETVNMWERGARDIKAGMIVAIAEALKTTCDYLLRGVETSNIGICEDLGLSNEVVASIRDVRNSYTPTLNALNCLLTPQYFPILINIYNYLVTDFCHPITIRKQPDGQPDILDSVDTSLPVAFMQYQSPDSITLSRNAYLMQGNSDIYENAFLSSVTESIKKSKKRICEEARNAQESNS